MLVFLFIALCSTTYCAAHSDDIKSHHYASVIISKFSPNETLSLEQFQELFNQFLSEDLGYGKRTPEEHNEWCGTIGNLTTSRTCDKCSPATGVFNQYANNSLLDSSTLLHALPALVVALEEELCKVRVLNTSREEEDDGIHIPEKPDTAEVWGYGLGVVLGVCLISNLGAFLTPMMNTAFFQKLLMFLVAVAIGTQAGAGIVVLIPESMHLMYVEETKDTYLWKCCCVLGGIIFVLVLERALKIGFHHRKTTKERTLAEISIEAGSQVTMTTIDSASSIPEKSLEVNQVVVSNGSSANAANGSSVSVISNGVVNGKTENGGSTEHVKPKQVIATVAWMVMLGDAIHKFVDGLSVGAAYTENMTTGLTLAISIICEEIPHELGDISILLHSGMTMKQALFYNTMSAAMGIPGLIVGIFLGETTDANQWLFAIAAGIFIYVPLADMLPEMSHAVDKALKEETGAIFLSFLQLIGLTLGFGIIIMVAYYMGNIQR